VRDSMYDDVAVRIALTVARYDSDGPIDGAIVDTVAGGQFYRSVMFVVHAGAIEDGSYSVGLQHSDDEFTGWASVDQDHIQGALGYDLTEADERSVRRIGYLGEKRFVHITLTASDVTNGGDFGAIALLSAGARAVPA
jgi:hypothetical protein